jgi:predicted nucleic acid-binding Zn ribbon protein
MQYDFECECGNAQFFTAPIEIGPPEQMLCVECGKEMYRLFTTNVVFKGTGWPSKDLKIEKTGEDPVVLEAHEKKTDERRVEQENSNAVLTERRKGRKSFAKYKKKHPDKVDKYRQSLAKGMKGE